MNVHSCTVSSVGSRWGSEGSLESYGSHAGLNIFSLGWQSLFRRATLSLDSAYFGDTDQIIEQQ